MIASLAALSQAVKLTADSVPSSVPAIDKEIFEIENKMRTDPQSFVPKYEEYLTQFEGNMWHKPGQWPRYTWEGAAAV